MLPDMYIEEFWALMLYLQTFKYVFFPLYIEHHILLFTFQSLEKLSEFPFICVKDVFAYSVCFPPLTNETSWNSVPVYNGSHSKCDIIITFIIIIKPANNEDINHHESKKIMRQG